MMDVLWTYYVKATMHCGKTIINYVYCSKTIIHYVYIMWNHNALWRSHNILCKMYIALWTKYVDMGMNKILVDHSLGILLCFFHSLFLFMMMNCIDYILYVLCTGYEPSNLDYGCYIMIISIMDRYRLLWYWQARKHII